MSKLKVYDMGGSEVGDLEVADSLLGEAKGQAAVHDTVVGFLAHQRSGTASTLRKGEVAGSNAKPWRQKGTGRARAGYRQSPVWRGGGVAFGPHPRQYGGKLNKKVKRLAFRRAFGEKVRAGEVRVLSELTLAEPKTKAFAGVLKSLGVAGAALIVVDTMDANVAMASRNVPKVAVVRAADLNVYQLVRYPQVLVCKAAMGELEARLSGKGEGGHEEP